MTSQACYECGTHLHTNADIVVLDLEVWVIDEDGERLEVRPTILCTKCAPEFAAEAVTA